MNTLDKILKYWINLFRIFFIKVDNHNGDYSQIFTVLSEMVVTRWGLIKIFYICIYYIQCSHLLQIPKAIAQPALRLIRDVWCFSSLLVGVNPTSKWSLCGRTGCVMHLPVAKLLETPLQIRTSLTVNALNSKSYASHLAEHFNSVDLIDYVLNF